MKTWFHSKIGPWVLSTYYPMLIRKFCKNMRSSKDHFPTFHETTHGKENDFHKYLCEIVAKIKTIPRCESMGYGVPIYEEKNRILKSCATVHLIFNGTNHSCLPWACQGFLYKLRLIFQSWAHRSLKSLNRSSLLSKPSFWEQWRSVRKRAKSDEWTDIIQIMSGLLMSNIRTKEHSKNGWKMHINARSVHI